MNDEAVSPLRRRMIEDMTIRHFAARMQTNYIRTVRTFAAFLGQSPDQVEPKDLRRFQLRQSRGEHLCGNKGRRGRAHQIG